MASPSNHHLGSFSTRRELRHLIGRHRTPRDFYLLLHWTEMTPLRTLTKTATNANRSPGHFSQEYQIIHDTNKPLSSPSNLETSSQRIPPVHEPSSLCDNRPSRQPFEPPIFLFFFPGASCPSKHL